MAQGGWDFGEHSQRPGSYFALEMLVEVTPHLILHPIDEDLSLGTPGPPPHRRRPVVGDPGCWATFTRSLRELSARR